MDFGSSDKPLPTDELAKDGLVQFPSVIGGVVPVVNLPGIEAGKLRLTGPLLADIYLGKVTRWNDPAIAAINPGLTLPADKINVVHRSDGSGTTFNFTNYLSKVSPDWKAKVGEGTTVNWIATSVGGKGNEGVASYVKQLKGAIGYVELSYALQNRMAYAAMRMPPATGCSPARRASRQPPPAPTGRMRSDFALVITDAPGADAWPIAATNFILMHKQPRDRRVGRGRARVLPLGLGQRRRAGSRAGLRAAAAGTGAPDRGVLGRAARLTPPRAAGPIPTVPAPRA